LRLRRKNMPPFSNPKSRSTRGSSPLHAHIAQPPTANPLPPYIAHPANSENLCVFPRNCGTWVRLPPMALARISLVPVGSKANDTGEHPESPYDILKKPVDECGKSGSFHVPAAKGGTPAERQRALKTCSEAEGKRVWLSQIARTSGMCSRKLCSDLQNPLMFVTGECGSMAIWFFSRQVP